MALSDFLSSEILKKLADASIEKGNVYRIEMDESNGLRPSILETLQDISISLYSGLTMQVMCMEV